LLNRRVFFDPGIEQIFSADWLFLNLNSGGPKMAMTDNEIREILVEARDRLYKPPVACQPDCKCLDCRLTAAIRELFYRDKGRINES
jgi:hypothetical protein